MSGFLCWLTHQRRALWDRDREAFWRGWWFKGSLHKNWRANCSVLCQEDFLHAYLNRNFYLTYWNTPKSLIYSNHSLTSDLIFSVFATCVTNSLFLKDIPAEENCTKSLTVYACVYPLICPGSSAAGALAKKCEKTNHGCWPFRVPSCCAWIISRQAVVSVHGSDEEAKVPELLLIGLGQFLPDLRVLLHQPCCFICLYELLCSYEQTLEPWY